MFGIENMAKQALSSPEGQKMLMEYLSSPEGLQTIKEFASTAQGKQLIGSAIKTLTQGIGLPAEQADEVMKIISQFI